jgi:AraC-like DNA-binding protein/ligand-binding sensor protein
MNSANISLIEQLSKSRIYRDYEAAFGSATGLPLTLRHADSLALGLQGQGNENPFCAIMAESSPSCAACLEVQELIRSTEGEAAKSVTCFAGLCDTGVPIRVGPELVGFLQTGQVSLKPLTSKGFHKVAQRLVEMGAKVDLRRLEDAYFHSRMLTEEQYAGFVRLLEIFANHLSLVANQLMVQEATQESPFGRRVKAYVEEHMADEIDLEHAAHALHVSTFYFCKMFKKTTGLTFTDYLGRVRIERAKALLLDHNKHISEVAYEVGFGSLSHFNRVFKKVAGRSPTEYRERLPHPARR